VVDDINKTKPEDSVGITPAEKEGNTMFTIVSYSGIWLHIYNVKNNSSTCIKIA
jgi:hypothetical protein